LKDVLTFSEIEKIYLRFGLEMKPVKQAAEFLELINDLAGGHSKPMLFQEIQNELKNTFSHIKQQETTLRQSMENFKSLVLRERVLQTLQEMTG
jgi:Mg2+ and Co2+ transporter CorA